MIGVVRASVLGLGFALSLIGCMHSPAGQPEAEVRKKGTEMQTRDKLESLSEPSIQGPTLVFGVKSFGCTKSSDFSINAKAESGRCLVEVLREVPDYCKQAPSIRTMRIEWAAPDDCAGLPVEFSNPLLK